MDINRQREEAQRQRRKQASQLALELARYECPDFPDMPYRVQSNDPLNRRVQSILGKFDVGLVSAQSCLGVALTPLTPAVMTKESPLLANRASLSATSVSLSSTSAAEQKSGVKSSARVTNANSTGSTLNTSAVSKTKVTLGTQPKTADITQTSAPRPSAASNEDSKTSKLKIKIPSNDQFSIDAILQDVQLPPQLSSIHTPTKAVPPKFPPVTDANCNGSQLSDFDLSSDSDDSNNSDDSNDSDDSEEDVEEATVNTNVSAPDSSPKPSAENRRTATPNERPNVGSNSSHIPTLSDESDDNEDSCDSLSLPTLPTYGLSSLNTMAVTNTPVMPSPRLSFVDGHPSIVVKIPLINRLQKLKDAGVPAPTDQGVIAAALLPDQMLVQQNTNSTPAVVPAAVKGSQLARETIAKIVGAEAQLPTTLKIPKRRIQDDDDKREGDNKRYRRSPHRTSLRPHHDGDSQQSRRYERNYNRPRPRYNDFDQPPDVDEEVMHAFYGDPRTAEMYAVPKPQDPYADFDPDINGAAAEDALEQDGMSQPDNSAATGRQNFKKIGAQWSAMVTGDGSDRLREDGPRYSKSRDDGGRDGAPWRDDGGREVPFRSRYRRDHSSDVDRRRRTASPRRTSRSPVARTDLALRGPQAAALSPHVPRPMVDEGIQAPDDSESVPVACVHCGGIASQDGLSQGLVEPAKHETNDADTQCPRASFDAVKKDYVSTLKTADHYYHQARQIKHHGSEQTDLFKRSICFLESAVMFVEHCYCLDRRNTDTVYSTYEDVIKMCHIVGSRMLKDAAARTTKWFILDALSLRVQSCIRQQMWKLKIADCQRKKETVDGFLRKKLGNAEAISSAGSVKSDSGSSVDSPAGVLPGQQDITVPKEVMTSVREYMTGVENLVASCQLWDKASTIVTTSGKDFFPAVNLECGEVSRDSHISAHIVYLREAIVRLRSIE